MLDSTFELASPKAITESKTKYNYVLAHLPPEIATVVRDQCQYLCKRFWLSFHRFLRTRQQILADRILDINSTSISTISSGSERNSSPVKELKSDIDFLRSEIKELRKDVAGLRRSRRRFRSPSSTRHARSKSGGNRYYWYHFRFHEKATRCIPPCSFKRNPVPEE
ncbi:hypothetical protein HNY73_003247 [Argiope bruennichi]|uniref:DUF7041 domain-containing protein n=1 Tax=Argiope bruennichi TaxID=94029 RepID=A0A8T0FW98_ARGBR|nr:hypothetical protein HNY73_003247 [Argiope bruennichi]